MLTLILFDGGDIALGIFLVVVALIIICAVAIAIAFFGGRRQ